VGPVNSAAGSAQSPRGAALGEQLRQAAEALIGVVQTIAPERWMNVPRPGVWSVGKDAEHVADAAEYHQWIVSLSLGQKVPARPRIERARLTAQQSQGDIIELLRERTDAALMLIAGLSDDQLDLPVRPPRARSPTLEQMIEQVLIGHYHTHRREIEAKLHD
jgi:hypothetical protein